MCFSVFTVNSLKAPVSEFTIHNFADGNKVRRMDSGYCGFVNQLSQPPKFTSLSLAEDDFPPVKVRPPGHLRNPRGLQSPNCWVFQQIRPQKEIEIFQVGERWLQNLSGHMLSEVPPTVSTSKKTSLCQDISSMEQQIKLRRTLLACIRHYDKHTRMGPKLAVEISSIFQLQPRLSVKDTVRSQAMENDSFGSQQICILRKYSGKMWKRLFGCHLVKGLTVWCLVISRLAKSVE